MATRVRVTYLDGQVVEERIPPPAQTMTERHFKGINEKNALQASYFMAWVALRGAGDEQAKQNEFDPWLYLLDDVETFVGKSVREQIYDTLKARDLLDRAEADQILELASELDRREDDDEDPTRSDPSLDGSSKSASPPASPTSSLNP